MPDMPGDNIDPRRFAEHSGIVHAVYTHWYTEKNELRFLGVCDAEAAAYWEVKDKPVTCLECISKCEQPLI